MAREMTAAKPEVTVAKQPGADVIDHAGVDKIAQGRQASLAVRRERAQVRREALLPVIAELREAGAASYQAIADGLNGHDVPAPRGGRWRSSQVRHILKYPR